MLAASGAEAAGYLMDDFGLLRSQARRIASASCLKCEASDTGRFFCVSFGDPDLVVVGTKFAKSTEAMQYLDGIIHALQVTGRWDLD